MFKKSKNVLKFITPAGGIENKWREGLFTGNGTIGVNVLGSVSREVVVVNHTDLWWQGNTGVLPDVSDKTKNIKKNLDALSFRDAETVLTNALNAKNYKPELAYPLPVCDFVLNMPVENTATEYERAVNLETGEVNVSFKDRGVRFDRNLFVSRVNYTIFYEITSSGSKKVNVDFTIAAHDKTNNRTPDFDNFEINANSLIDKVINYVFPKDEVFASYLSDTIKRVKIYELEKQRDEIKAKMLTSNSTQEQYVYLNELQEITKKINEVKRDSN